MKTVDRDTYAEAVKAAEAAGATTHPVTTVSNHPTAPKLAAMQTSKDGVLLAQAIYGKSLKPRYQVRP